MNYLEENRVYSLYVEDFELQGLWNQAYLMISNYAKETSWYGLLRDYLLLMFVCKYLSLLAFNLKVYGPIGMIKKSYRNIARKAFKYLLESRVLKAKVDKQVAKVRNALEKDLIKNSNNLRDFEALPTNGISTDEVVEELNKLATSLERTKWEAGRVSGAVYHGGPDLIHLQTLAFEKFCVANQLHPDVFPAVRKMEAEVVAMILNMFNAPKTTGCGTTTSGGTESLLLACLSAKFYAYHHHGITKPEIIAPITVHAGVDKAAYYFGIKLHHVDVDPVTYQVNLRQVRKFINKNTVLIVGSAPNFPHGIVDDIQGLGELAQKHNLLLHVDCCLGSFVAAFKEKAGFTDTPPFDFRVPGVTSISCDTHKYGFAPKGSSVIMYRNEDLRMHQYFVTTEWTGGLYGSPTLAGSRPGALVVGCWATMINMGEDGYIKSCRDIINAARKLRHYIETKIPELSIIGNPLHSVVSFKSDVLNVYELADRLSKNGWHLNALQNPAALHMAVTGPSINAIDELCSVLSTLVSEMIAEGNVKPADDGTNALYGVAGSVQTSGVADRLIVAFLDTLYKLKPSE